jgi:hypothetical protein
MRQTGVIKMPKGKAERYNAEKTFLKEENKFQQ